ncbi:hypothetical protein GALMADRAFT_130070 [Galerina marginata CBS 339.88]|uniref:Protein HGH1 homolog n=1 Tax=Galerina marginata (strain CBS 339.88) TaxID=685588 RepID=A0A067SIT0_GALM3|nr:hypothetical protein GALMADRAFT_130070 [Galerina marginata CBS 339.88]
MDTQLRELVQFLRDRNPQVRQIALENLLPQTIKGAPHRDIFFSGLQSGGLQKPKESDIIRDLKLLCRDQLSVAHDAFRALVNLSDSPLMIAPLSEPSFISFITSYIINPHSILADLAAMLLSNLTAASTACSILLTLNVPIIPDDRLSNSVYPTESRCGSCPAPVPYPSAETKEILALPFLIDAFVEGAQVVESGDLSKRTRKAELHFLANVFANMTVSPVGRNYFLSPQPTTASKPDQLLEYPLAKLVAFTEHADTMRRGGVASALKNCSFHAPGHKAILSPESDAVAVPPSKATAPGIDALPYILLPLAGPEEFDLDDQEKLPEALQFLPPTKKREPDSTIRLTHIETLLLLCHTRWGRDYQRQHGVYEIVRAAHENETVDKISEHVERLVQLLHGEEPKITSADDDFEDLSTNSEKQMGFTNPSGATTKAAEDSDDEDLRIEEI